MFATQLRRVLYTLKRQFGLQVRFYVNNGATIDFSTGERTSNDTMIVIERAIRLPEKLSQAKFTVFGKSNLGAFDMYDRTLILDAQDLRSIKPKREDHVEFGNLRYTIQKVESLDYNAGYMIGMNAIPEEDMTPLAFSDEVVLDDTTTEEIQ